MLYLDNAATTRVFDEAVKAASNAMTDEYFNPNATYKSAVTVNEGIERARKQIASVIGALPNEIVFTSGATESNNWVFSNGRKNKKGNVVISAGEHSSVYEPAMRLKNSGVDVRIAPLLKTGAVDIKALMELVDSDTSLVSIIHVSNETGVVNPIKAITSEIKSKNPHTLVHSDGVQGMIKVSEGLDDLGVDYYSASAHKLGAPKGIGLLFIKKGLNIAPMICGGGQERGMRSGTQNTPYIAAFSEAVKCFAEISDRDKIVQLREKLCDYFVSNGCKIIGTGENSGYILCVCVPGVKAEILQNAVHDCGVIIGKGAACSGSKRGNRILSAMKVAPSDIECCIRISMFADTSTDDALSAAEVIIQCAKKIRSAHV